MKVRTIKAKHVNAILRIRKYARITLHKMLEEVRRQYDRGTLCSGICFELRRVSSCKYGYSVFEEELYTLFKNWPEFSGDELYPVPSPSNLLSYEEAYRYFPLWYTGEYAASRLRLLDYLIEQTK